MADITVRKIRFAFDEPIDFRVSDEMLGAILPPLGLSMTMPYLEPYLMRSMKAALNPLAFAAAATRAADFSSGQVQ